MRYLYTDVNKVARLISEAASNCKSFVFAFNFELTEALFIPDPLSQTEVLFSTPLGSNSLPQIATRNIKIVPQSISFEQYKQQFDIVMNNLKLGNTFLTNLAVQTPIVANTSLREIYMHSAAPYMLYIPDRMVCFSPERFVHISADGQISTCPMKGTISANTPNAEHIILSDPKEKAEHATVVDLLRNDISINASHVLVKRYRYLSEIETSNGNLLQVSSEICGLLPKGWQKNLGQIILSMLPAGSVSGAPKRATINTIHMAEQQMRGFYTGVFGYFDGHELDSGVIIRYIETINGQLFFRSGGGITARSDVRKEYAEVLQKIYLPIHRPLFTEVICIKNGQLQHLNCHQKRVDRTTSHFWGSKINLANGIVVPPNARNGIFRCRIEYDSIIRKVEFSSYSAKEITTCSIVHDNTIDFSYKYVNRSRLNALLQQAGTDDIIIIKNGMVTDSSFCNLVFANSQGKLFTPSTPLMRGTCITRLVQSGLVTEMPITEVMLRTFVSVRFVNAMRGLEQIALSISKLIS